MKLVSSLEEILADEEKLKGVMKDELRKVKKEYATPRKTDIKDEITEIKIDNTVMIPKEDVIVLVTKDGYVKRTSMRSYQASSDDITLKENDYILGFYEINTMDTILLFTNLGNYLYVPVHTIPDLKWKDLGKHVSNLIKLEENEEVIASIPVYDFNKNSDITIATRNGMIKRTPISEFQVSRYSKPISCMKLKDDDYVVTAFETIYNEIFISTTDSYGLWFDKGDIPVVGLKTSGVKSITLKNDKVANVSNFDTNIHEYLLVVTDKGTGKRVKINEFEKSVRARRGLLILREVKTNPYKIIKTFTIYHKDHIGVKNADINILKNTEFPIMDRYSTGSSISKHEIYDAFKVKELEKKDLILEPNPVKEETKVEVKQTPTKEDKKKVYLKEIDDRLLTIDDFLGDD